MKSLVARSIFCVGCVVWLIGAPVSEASLTIASGLGTTHVGNLVLNGSFELGAPPLDGVPNSYDFANPLSPNYASLPNWITNGANSTTIWGNDGPSPYRVGLSDVLPDGRVGLDFRTATNVFVSQPPSFNLVNGVVNFPAAPVFSSTAGAPVTIRQTVPTNLVPQPSYNLSFWVSGEENSTNQGNTGLGLIGLQVTNTLPGDPIRWLAVPNTVFFGQSKLYEFQFTPLNPLLSVDVVFTNWGGLNLTPYGMSAFGTQPILDDVIINGVPEPATLWILLAGVAALAVVRRVGRPSPRME
jgi:hypothetical protein